MAEAFIVAQGQPVLIDRFLEDAIEVDVDAICDGEQRDRRRHHGAYRRSRHPLGRFGLRDSAVQPAGPDRCDEIREATHALARRLRVVGLMNIQFAIKKEDGQQNVYVLEVNPRASRTVPFVSKATGMPVAKIAAKVMAGVSLAEQGIDTEPIPSHVSVKESVFPFRKFAGVDIVLGPEMRSTGEVMGISERFSIAFAKSQLAAGTVLPTEGTIFISVAPPAKEHMVGLAQRLAAMGFKLMATEGTARRLEAAGIRRAARQQAAGRPSEPARLPDRRRASS